MINDAGSPILVPLSLIFFFFFFNSHLFFDCHCCGVRPTRYLFQNILSNANNYFRKYSFLDGNPRDREKESESERDRERRKKVSRFFYRLWPPRTAPWELVRCLYISECRCRDTEDSHTGIALSMQYSLKVPMHRRIVTTKLKERDRRSRTEASSSSCPFSTSSSCSGFFFDTQEAQTHEAHIASHCHW